MRCNEIQGAKGVENAEVTSLASGRNADGSDTRYFFADVLREVWKLNGLPSEIELDLDGKFWANFGHDRAKY